MGFRKNPTNDNNNSSNNNNNNNNNNRDDLKNKEGEDVAVIEATEEEGERQDGHTSWLLSLRPLGKYGPTQDYQALRQLRRPLPQERVKRAERCHGRAHRTLRSGEKLKSDSTLHSCRSK